MSKTKVVPIEHHFPSSAEEARIVACDESKVGGAYRRRLILNVGRQRIAFDFTGRATELDPATGDQPAPVLPVDRKAKRRPTRKAPRTA